jgi:hypothetical protein
MLGLPQYAQTYIRQLEQRIASVRARQQEQAGQGPEYSNVRIRATYASDDPDRLLGRNIRVTFDLVDLSRVGSVKSEDGPILPRLPKARIDVHHQGLHRLILMGYPGKLRIDPLSTNLIAVTVEGS